MASTDVIALISGIIASFLEVLPSVMAHVASFSGVLVSFFCALSLIKSVVEALLGVVGVQELS